MALEKEEEIRLSSCNKIVTFMSGFYQHLRRIDVALWGKWAKDDPTQSSMFILNVFIPLSKTKGYDS